MTDGGVELANEGLLVAERKKEAGAGQTKNGNAKRIRILEAARAAIIEDGFASFTLRNVSNRAQIHLKTLQYYFQNKEELISETIKFTTDSYYFAKFEDLYQLSDDFSPIDALTVTIKYLLDDLDSDESVQLFFELGALAMRDTAAAEALETLYARHRHHLGELISQANPDLSKKETAHRATMIAAQIEGLVLFVNKRLNPNSECAGIEEEALQAIIRYAVSESSDT